MAYNMNLVTGSLGTDHVTSADDGALYAAIFGSGQYVMNGMEHRVVNNNQIQIAAGSVLINGRFARINYGNTAQIPIENGTSGMKRNDLIVITYRYGSAESASIDVIKGNVTSGDASDPAYVSGDILKGDSVVQMPLYRVRINGISIEGVDFLGQRVNSLMDVMKSLYPPVGSIIENADGANPSLRYPGTTWVLHGAGRVAVCVDTSDGDFGAGKTGGSKSVTLVSANIPPHSHVVPSHTHGMNHSHSIPQLTGTALASGSEHEHCAHYNSDGGSGSKNRYLPSGKKNSETPLTLKDGAHTHTIRTNAGTTGGSSIALTGNSNQFSTANTGNGTPVNTMDPYITVYRWRRTA